MLNYPKSLQRLCCLSATLLLTVCAHGQSRQQQPMIFAPTETLVKEVEKPYRDAICLNGSWQFQPVDLPIGFREGEDASPTLPTIDEAKWSSTLVKIPSPWNVNSFAEKDRGGDFRSYPSYPEAWEQVKLGWLKKTFHIPASWKGKRIQLHFEAVAGDAQIIVNGKEVGTHFDIFLPFDIDITDAVKLGQENTLYVGIRKASLFDKRSTNGRRTYQAGSFWGQHIAGIWQDVHVVASPAVSIADTYIKPWLDKNTLAVEVTLTNQTSHAVQGELGGNVYEWLPTIGPDGLASPASQTKLAEKPALSIPPITVSIPAHGETKVELSVRVADQLKTWSPEAPNLYGMVLHVAHDKQRIDSKYERFGWRQTTIEGSKFLLNGKPVTMKGDSWHFMGIPQMTRRYAWAWYKALKDAHSNAVRLHAQPFPAFYLDMADEMGILVLDETAVWASDGGPNFGDERYWKDSEKHLSALIRRDRNHPSVFGWSVSNEVMPVIVNVMRNPPGLRDKLIAYYGVWADICRTLDPTRPWISADGEDDGQGKLPIYMIHYGGEGGMDHARNSGKPWGVGEDGNAYYGTPQQVAATNGSRAYESFLGRMEGVARSSYQSLVAQRQRDASYRSVFNLAWYGLKPLAIGLKDTSKAPTLDDGIYFAAFQEGTPGVQPERLGPYTTTFNPGYDPALPLYETWPLFDAIQDAAADPLAPFEIPLTEGGKMPYSFAVKGGITAVEVIGGQGSTLAADLLNLGVPVQQAKERELPDVLFIDGSHPPEASAAKRASAVQAKGGTVWIWGVSPAALPQLGALLPAPVEVTDRKASSLLIRHQSNLTDSMEHADWYFSELVPAEIVQHGLGGELVRTSTVLLEANPTDWLKWNKQGEYVKTAMVLRSEREEKPAGAVLIGHRVGNGNLLVTTLPGRIPLAKAKSAVKTLLSNAGIALQPAVEGKPLTASGEIANVLYLGNFPVSSASNGAQHTLPLAQRDAFKPDATTAGKQWTVVPAENGFLDLKSLAIPDQKDHAVAYLSFWVSSPRSLADLLVEPNMPQVNLEVAADDAVQAWLNGEQIIDNIRVGPIEGGQTSAEAMKLRQGWNHILIKVIQEGGDWKFSGRLTSNQPAFLAELGAAFEKP
ncbi:glycoside hydrolase family 2 protein [Parapedobacter koreensis]|uniref:Beta-galactosidase n=1 Tax=Parapedobacter koreensis TaxID=332977 RepID=A0A1H7JZM6_9SPHI|nr:sugar-binding domain-containing protein [Parapedobacter koreensis]SEK79814.1 beta-galactosidase [Parapedobacter koreensis]